MSLQGFESVPELHSERLLLRPLGPPDAEGVFRIFSDPEVTRLTDADTMTHAQEASVLIEFLQQRFESGTGVRWGIVTKDDGELIGTIGFNQIVAWSHRASLGYDVRRSSWRHGFATEAVKTVVAFGQTALGLHRVEAMVMIGNEASARVLQRCGFEEEGLLRGYGFWKGRHHDLIVFSVLAPG